MMGIVGRKRHTVQCIVLFLNHRWTPVLFVPLGQYPTQGMELALKPPITAQPGVDLAQDAQFFHPGQAVLRRLFLEE